jgi:GT2 family glycosyltransferase
MIDLSIVIVSWNTRDLLRQCIRSVIETTENLKYEIFVVDNNSSDNTVEMVRKEFPQVKLIENKFNAGFAKANNQAIKISEGKYIILLNPDTIVKKDALYNMLKFMENDKNIGIVGCKLLNTDGTLQESCRRFPDLPTYINILLKTHIVFPNLKCLKRYFMKDMNYDKINEVDQVMGAALMYRRDVLGEESYLDEDYWIWFEEVDFCFKVKKQGCKVVYIPHAEIVHYKAQSFNQLMKVRQQKVFNKSLLTYFVKNGTQKETFILKLVFPISLALSFLIQNAQKVKKRS